MRTFFATLGTAAMLVTGIAATSTPADAGDRFYRGHHGWRHDGWNRHRGGWDRGDSLAAGVIGLGAGALIGSAIANSRRPYYDDYRGYRPYYQDYYGGAVLEGPIYERRVIEIERPVRYREAPRYYGYDHVAACEDRYRSYDRRSDTFVGYDGRVRRCRL